MKDERVADRKAAAENVRSSIRISAWSSSTCSVGRPSSLDHDDKAGATADIDGKARIDRAIASGTLTQRDQTHCRTLPSGPICGSALQEPLAKRACWPATGFSAAAACTRDGAVAAMKNAIATPDLAHPFADRHGVRSRRDIRLKDLVSPRGAQGSLPTKLRGSIRPNYSAGIRSGRSACRC